jgi:hypothetical protein
MNLYELHNKPATLYGYDQQYKLPEVAYKEASLNKGRSADLESFIMKDLNMHSSMLGIS